MDNIIELKKKAYQLRMDALSALYESEMPYGHIGGCFSAAEIMAVLFYDTMKMDPSDPLWEGRDRFLLAKGHNALIQYAVLADKGYFDKSILKTYRAKDSILQGHPDANKTPGIEMTSGSLGQGLSYVVGMALAARLKNISPYYFCLLGDGEIQEGMIWEAAMAASHYKLNNIIAFVDRNHLEVNGDVDTLMGIEPIAERFESFGWKAKRIDGHSIEEIIDAIDWAKKSETKPSVIICETIKGKGVSFMENVREWHSNAVTDEVYEKAMKELSKAYEELEED